MPEARVIPIRPDDDDAYVPPVSAPGWEDQLAGGLEFLRRRVTGDYETDEFGFDPDLTDHVLLPMLRPLFERWFRVESQGMENVPTEGGGHDRQAEAAGEQGVDPGSDEVGEPEGHDVHVGTPAGWSSCAAA